VAVRCQHLPRIHHVLTTKKPPPAPRFFKNTPQKQGKTKIFPRTRHKQFFPPGIAARTP